MNKTRSPIFPGHCTGKRAPRLDQRTFKVEKYLPKIIPPAPPEVSWVTKVPAWKMFLNDVLGTCVVAAAGNMINQWCYYATGKESTVSDADILKVYEFFGYDPAQTQPDGSNPTDNGLVMLDFLNYWRQIGVGGHKILAFATVDVSRRDQTMATIQLFGNQMTGLGLPISAQGQGAWTVPDGGPFGNGSPGSWGGHCVPNVAGSPVTDTAITWADRIKMSRNFYTDYADEAYAVLSEDWIEATGLSPSHFNLAQLKADLALL